MEDRGDDGWRRDDQGTGAAHDDQGNDRPHDDAGGSGPGGAPDGRYGYTHDPYAGAPPPQPQPGYRYDASQHPVQQQRTNVFAVVSIVASALGLVGMLAFIGSIAGIVFAVLARKEIEADPSQQGKALADWGLILGIVGLVFWFFMGMMMVFMRAIFGELFWWDGWWY